MDQLPTCPLHLCHFDTKAAVYSIVGTDMLSMAFALFYSQYFTLHADWQRKRIMFILENSLANPQGPCLKKVQPFRDFAQACVRVWRQEETAAVALATAPPRYLFVGMAANGDPLPGRGHFQALLLDLQRLGRPDA